MKTQSAVVLAALALCAAHSFALTPTPTDLATLGTKSYESQWDGSLRVYRDLAYSTRNDLSNEGSGYTGSGTGTHRSGTYYNIYVKNSLFTSVDQRSKMPVFLFLHGGAWCQPYDKDVSCEGILQYTANKGYLVITMNYQLQNDVLTDSNATERPNATFGHMLEDVDTMLAYLKTELPKINVPTNMIVIGGESAGGHLAMCYAFDQANPLPMSSVGLAPLTHPLPISCVMSDVGPTDLSGGSMASMMFSPMFDLIAAYSPEMKGFKKVFGWLTGSDWMDSSMTYEQAKADMQTWAPNFYITRNTCPAIFAYGCTDDTPTESSSDSLVPLSNFIDLTNRYTKAGIPYSAKVYTNTDHGSVAWTAQEWIADRLYDFKTNHFNVTIPAVDQGPSVSYGTLDTSIFAKKVDVTFNGYSSTSTLTNFPVLVKLSTAINGFSYSDFKQSNGGDLRFMASNGKLIPHEIDTWNPNGVSTVWVKVPKLTGTTTTITACYGCANPPVVNPKDVWDSNYVGVWHLGESALPLKESSKRSRDFSAAIGTGIGYASSGIVGGSVNFGATGKGRMLDAATTNNLSGFAKCTIEAWTYLTTRPTGSDKAVAFLSKRNPSNKDYSYYLYDNGSGTSINVSSNGTNGTGAGVSISSVASNAWTHQVFTFNAGNTETYKNGANKKTGTCAVTNKIKSASADLHLGNFQMGDSRNFPGKIDEVRISKVVRSEDWVKATYETVTKSSFATYALVAENEPEPDPEADPVWSNFSKFMTVFFRGVQQGVALTNFPVLVKLSTDIDGFSYSDFKKPNGGDLRFADSAGNFLPHEIDAWNSNGVSTVWVKVPVLSHASKITAYYGATNPGRAPAAKDVWDDDYVGVWHLGESALPLKESSATSSDFTTEYGSSVAYAAEGIVGGSVDFSANGQYNSVVAPDHDALDGFSKFTIESWTRQDGHKQNAGILSKRGGYNVETAYYLFDSGSTVPICVPTNKNVGADWAYHQVQTLGEWNYLAYTVDMTKTSSNVHGVKNGVSSTWYNSKDFKGAMGNSASDLCLGNLYVNNKDYSFNGKIDEVRISKTVRSDAWLSATYETIASTLALYRVGETDLPSDTAVSNLLLKAATDKENPIDYKEGDPITFNFRLEGVDMLPQEVQVKQPIYVIWTRTGDDGVTVKGTNTISLTQGFSATTSLAIPGIVRMTAKLYGNDYKAFTYKDPKDGSTKNVAFEGGAGVATEKMQLSTVEPANFDQFWREAKAKLAAVPFNDGNVELTEVFPSSQTNTHRFFAVKIPCLGPRPVTGWLTVPKNPQAGGVPIRALFDGYGCVKTAPKPPTSNSGQQVRFQVNAHGYDLVGHDNQYYQDFYSSLYPSGGYSYGLDPAIYDNPTNTYFYYMALRVVRAFDYLKTRPEWDGKTIIAEGGSQGGLQTMWAGGLVDGISQIKPYVTWGCDIGCPFNGNGPYPSRTWGIPCVPGAFYFDSALHAKRVPRACTATITSIRLGDYTSPPRGVLLSYYNMKCKVSAVLDQGSTHGYVPPQPNQKFTISKDAEPELLPPVVADADGFDWTNRVVTVSGAQAGKMVSLLLTGHDGTPVAYTATADSNGSATFNVQTAPGASYSYTVTQEGAAPASGAFSTGSWKGSGTWFAGAVENGAPVASGGSWTGATVVSAGGNALEGDASFALDADAVAIGSNRLVRIDFDIVSGQFCLESDLGQEEGSMFGCIAAVACTAGGNAWFAYDGSAWQRLYGEYTLDEDAPYIVRAELDLAQGEKGAVRYYVSDNAGASFTPLFADASSASAWISCNAADSRAVKSVATEGTKTLASVGGSLMGADIAEADGVGYESLSDAIAAATNSLALLTNAMWPSDTPVGTIAVDLGGHSLAGVQLDNTGKVVVGEGYSAIPGEGKINISLTQAAALGVDTTGKSPAQIASALAENGANGIPLWQSYALGLDPTDATAKPKATIAMSGENVELRLVGITVNAASGATVTYKVYKAADLADMANAEPASGDKAVDAAASVPKGASEERMFYQLKVDVKGY